MATAAKAMPARFDPSDEESADYLLEKMLKQAEELANKMSRQNSSSEVSVSTSTDAGSDLSNPAALADVTNNNNHKNILDDLSSDNDTELEELLKQSETLLGKMRAGGLSASTPEASVNSPPAADRVEPPKVSPNAPTSVYLLETAGTYDDVSSVGSNSLRSPILSPSLRMPTPMSDTIQEEPFAPSPFGKAMPRIPSINSADELLEAAAASDLNNANAGTSTKIPDFTATSTDAKWEKVASASQGDEDYVPLVDYSKLSPNTTTTTASSSRGGMQNYDGLQQEDDEYGTTDSVAATRTRVAAFRAQKKRLQKKKRRQMILLTLGVAVVGGYCWYARQPGKNSTTTDSSDNNDLATVEADFNSGNDAAEDSQCDISYDGILDEDLSCFDDITLSEVEESFSGLGLDQILEELGETEVSCDEDGECFEAGDEETVTIEGDADTISSSADSSSAAGELSNEVAQVDSKLIKKCKNPLQRIFNRMCRQLLECQTDSCLEKRCKNILQRIFNKKCRILARERKGKAGFHGINLQAVAGI